MIKTSNKMERTCAIKHLFNAVKTNHKQNARDVLEEAKQEHAILKNVEHINDKGKRSLQLISEIIEHVSKGQMKDAKAKYTQAEKGFSGHLKFHLLEERKRQIKEVKALSEDVPEENDDQKQGKQGKSQRSSDIASQGQHPPDITKQRTPRQETLEEPDHPLDLRRNGQTKTENPQTKIEYKDHMRSFKASDDFHKIERGKRASLKMRQNNPDIADLSDTNRPTKIAERFSELYDNEWTEAFEEISKKNRSEKETIEYLLAVVKEAYKFCSNAAEKQVKDITKVFGRILEFGPDDYNDKTLTSQSNTQNEEGRKLIVQYRKEIAEIALPKLKTDFLENKILQGNRKSKLPARLALFDLFAAKAVELTWWMCVQDPPIVLCPTTEGNKDSFDKSLYRAYTKSGSEPDFFVWPALKLHVEGGVLMKGVVQFK